jgi:hypothetical protein
MSALAAPGPRLQLRLATALASLWLGVWSGWISDARADISPDTRWADPAHVKLGVDFPGDGYHADWELFRCECGDLLVRSELNVPGEVEAGETLLVGGRAVLSRGFAQEPELGSSLDAPALMMQLALRLLERAEPGGPAKVTEARAIDVLEETSAIQLESYSASGGFQAPWALKGSIEPAGESRRRFDLSFEFTVGAGSEVQRGTMRLKGVADFDLLEFPLAGSAPLAKWTLSWRGEDEPAELAAKKPETLDDLRALLRNQ